MVTARKQTIYVAKDGSKHFTQWEAEHREAECQITEIVAALNLKHLPVEGIRACIRECFIDKELRASVLLVLSLAEKS